MKKSILVFASLFLFSFYGYAAQSIGFYAPKQGFNKYNQLGLAHGPALGGKPTMALKWNITAAAFSNINLSYEYFIAPKISLQLGFGFTPSSGVPLKDFFYSTINQKSLILYG